MVKCQKLVASSSLKLDAIWGSIPHASANGREMVRQHRHECDAVT